MDRPSGCHAAMAASRRRGKNSWEGGGRLGRPPPSQKPHPPPPARVPTWESRAAGRGRGTKGAVRPGCSYRGGGAVADRAWAHQVTAYEPCVNGIHSQSLSAVEGRLFDCDLHGRLQENQSGSDPSQTPVSCSAGLRSLAQPARAGRVLEGLGLRPRPPLL